MKMSQNDDMPSLINDQVKLFISSISKVDRILAKWLLLRQNSLLRSRAISHICISKGIDPQHYIHNNNAYVSYNQYLLGGNPDADVKLSVLVDSPIANPNHG